MKITLSRDDLVNMFASAFKVNSIEAKNTEDGELDQIVIDVETSLERDEIKEKVENSPEFG